MLLIFSIFDYILLPFARYLLLFEAGAVFSLIIRGGDGEEWILEKLLHCSLSFQVIMHTGSTTPRNME